MADERSPQHEPSLAEDAKHLSIVGTAAAVAAVLSLALIGPRLFASDGPREVRNVVVRVSGPSSPLVMVSTGSNVGRLYGTVHVRHGEPVTGYIRWDRNEGSWADLLDASKPRPRGSASQSGIRFGHIQRLDVISGDAAMLTLRSGERVELRALATDLGDGLRALVVETPSRGQVEMAWRDIEEVDFSEAAGTEPAEGRLYGTLTTRAGDEFTGFVTWDVDEIYTTDILDGDDERGARQRIPFGAIASIERESRRSARVTLGDGSVMILDGTNDVDSSISGISVSDPALGQVEVDWEGFRSVRFHDAEADAVLAEFDGGERLTGTVVTTSGRELSGEIVWDADETNTWEMLDGESGDATFKIELGRIATIAKAAWGSEVTLRDGRSFRLEGSNDVDDGNRGILVRTATGAHEIDWDDFVEVRFER